MTFERSKAEFETTQWTLIEDLRTDDPQRVEAAERRLVTQYWPAVYATLRRRGHDAEQAAEITQAFFADVVLGRKLFQRGDARRGRLRALLLTALKRYQIDQARRQRVRQRVIDLPVDALAREEQFVAEQDGADVEAVFDRRWAVAVLEEAMRRCEQRCREDGLERHWRAFETQVVQPASSGAATPTLAEVARRLNFASPTQVASATNVVRKRLRILLREVAAETAVSPAEQQAEYDHLVQLLG